MINKLINLYPYFIYFFCIIIFAFSLRGLYGNPNAANLTSPKWDESGPFELSPERGRFALSYSLIENKSFQFSNDLGKFASPDVAINNKGQFASLFAPLLSFIVIPGYIIGKFLGASQVGAFAVVSVFAILNAYLIRLIAIRLNANPLAATISSLLFLFATPAFSYGVDLYQHHITTFLILLSIYVIIRSTEAWALAIVFFLCALAIPLDYPNLFFMLPIGLFAFGKIFSFKKLANKLTAKISLLRLLSLFVMILPIVFFLWFNYESFGNPFQISGTLHSSKYIQSNDISSRLSVNSAPQRSLVSFFQTRDILQGFYIQFLSPDRGIIYYAPVVIFGIFGFALALKRKVRMTVILASVVCANILLYEMWGDPWGGWAFGSRYLIPSYAVLSIFTARLLTYWRKKILFILLLPVALYSIAVNTLGAITTSAIPPQVEVLQLEKISGIVQRYTFQKNWEFLLAGNCKSFVYQTFLKSLITPLQFYLYLTTSIFIIVGGMLIFYFFKTSKGEKYV